MNCTLPPLAIFWCGFMGDGGLQGLKGFCQAESMSVVSVVGWIWRVQVEFGRRLLPSMSQLCHPLQVAVSNCLLGARLLAGCIALTGIDDNR